MAVTRQPARYGSARRRRPRTAMPPAGRRTPGGLRRRRHGLRAVRWPAGVPSCEGFAVVVVDAQHVDRRRDDLQVAVLHDGRRTRGPATSSSTSAGYSPRKIGSRKIRLSCPSMRRAASRSSAEPGSTGSATVRLRVMPRRTSGSAPAQLGSGEAVPEQQVVGGREAGRAVLPARGVHAGGVAEERRAPRLVERGPDPHPVAERVVHRGGVVGEPVGGVAVGPAARVLQRLRQVPVVERQPGRDACASSSSTRRE